MDRFVIAQGQKLVLLMASDLILIPFYEQMQLSCKSLHRAQCWANVLIGIRKCQISIPKEEEIFGTVPKTYVLVLKLCLVLLLRL